LFADLTIFETLVASVFFQFCLYMALRMAHRGFTLGELGLVCFGGTALFLEFLNLTIAGVSVTQILSMFYIDEHSYGRSPPPSFEHTAYLLLCSHSKSHW